MKKSKYLVLNMAVACAAGLSLLTGCIGFTEDITCGDASMTSPGQDVSIDDDVYSRFAAARVAQSGKFEIDEHYDSVTITLETIGGCLGKDGVYGWDGDYYFADANTFAYSFRGDTLLLSRIYEPDPYEVNQERYEESFIWVGGTPGAFDGVWLMTQCRYREEKMYCTDDGYDQFFRFDNGKVEYRIADRENYDYMQTVFVDQLFEFLGDGGSIQLETPYYYSDTKYGQERSGVEILEKTNTAMKFAYGDMTFDLSVDYARYGDSLHVTLKSGDASCVGTVSEMSEVGPEMCVADNEDYLWETVSGTFKYERQNAREFESCIDRLLGRDGE